LPHCVCKVYICEIYASVERGVNSIENESKDQVFSHTQRRVDELEGAFTSVIKMPIPIFKMKQVVKGVKYF